MEFNELLEHIVLGEPDIAESHTNEQDMLGELLGVVWI